MAISSVRVLTYTNLFPNHLRPNFGVFVKNRMRTFAQKEGSNLDVIAPVPYFPYLPWHTRWEIFSQIRKQENQDGIRVYHPRYLVIPKIGMRIHGQAMYWATRNLVRRLHEQNPYDLIDAHWIYPDGFAAVKIAKELSLPVVLSARGNDINEYIDFSSIRPLITWCLQNSDHIISVCQALKDMMLSLGIPDSKITVIGNGVDINNFYPLPLPQEELRRRLGLPLNRRIVLSVGILELRKGHHILVEAIRQIKRECSDPPYLTIVGSGEFYSSLKTQIRKLQLEKDVHLVGEVSHQELKRWYNAADVFCLASDREGWPNVILEALACGTPVVASCVFGVPEILVCDDFGLLVHERSPEAFASQIRKALKRSWEPDKIVEFAQQHSWDKTVEVVRKVFMKVANISTV